MRPETDKFLWGAATSSHQVEGNNYLNDWWQWELASKTTAKSGIACDQYNRFREDFEIAKNLGHNAHRLSLEWSRLEPEKNKWDDNAFDHYRDVIAYLQHLGIEPIITLNHFTLPMWLAKEGGWSLRKSRFYFENFAKKVIEKLGDLGTYWIAINEPMILAFLSYFVGSWPPGESNIHKMLNVIENQMHAHVKAYKVMHETAKKIHGKKILVGIAKEAAMITPCNKNYLTNFMPAFWRHHFYNHLFIRAIKYGWLIFPGYYLEMLPYGNALDFIGLNYYRRFHIKYTGFGPLKMFGDQCACPEHNELVEKNSMGWEIYPEGLYEIIKSFSQYNLPIIITENGIPTDNEADRIKFIKTHLDAVQKAKKRGHPVMGYLHWSLIDNFEWADGFWPHFGLVGIDYHTQKRTVRESGRFYSDYIKKIGLAI